MTEPGSYPKKPTPVRQPVLLGLFTGTALGAGYLLAGVPNVELVSLIVALSGAVLGPVLGPLCGVLTGGIFAVANPLGMSPPLLVAVQAAGQGLMALAGWLAARHLVGGAGSGGRLRDRLAALAAGLVGTLIYDLLTVTASWVLFPDLPLKVVLVNSSSFVLLHTGINTAIFLVLFTALARRLRGLARSSLVGGQGLLILLLAVAFTAEAQASPRPMPDGPVRTRKAATDTIPTALPDTLPGVLPDSLFAPLVGRGAGPERWQRPLWDPFSATLMSYLDRRTAWVPVTDGGLGAMAMILGEASTSYAPTILREGLPIGTGHRLTDDPWLASNQALDVATGYGGFLSSGEGLVELWPQDRLPGKAVSHYHGVKGPHESYMRGISLLTPRTAWRLGFDFEETIDRLGYNWTDNLTDEDFQAEDEPRGNSSIRRARTRLVRRPGPDSYFSVEYHTDRKTRTEMLVLDAGVQEIWSDGARLDARQQVGDYRLRTALFWNNRTVEWGAQSVGTIARRKIETGREGILLELAASPADTLRSRDALRDLESALPQGSGLRVLFSRWDVLDNVERIEGGQAVDPSGSRATGQVQGTWGRLAPGGRLLAGITGDFLEGGGWHPGAFVQYGGAAADPHWRLRLERAGRAPRSDELLSPVRHHVYGRELVMLPNPDLQHENLLRASALLEWRLFGFDLEVDGAVRRLRDGITWEPAGDGSLTGTWRNALDMNSSRVTGSIARQGRFAGWVRARLEGTWQNFDEISSRAAFLPPEQYLRLELMWEQHFFQEDGILQMALLSTHRGTMNDPWDPSGGVVLPSSTTHDLLVGFRLVGAHISLNFRNLTDQRTRLSSNALGPGREMDMRLSWTFLY